jgi:hypothetical protein
LPETPPRVLVVSPEHWARALVRAELRERGYDAIGAGTIEVARRERPVDLLVLDQHALGERAQSVDELQSRLGRPATVLLALGLAEPPQGAWARVLRRPLRIGDVVAAIETLLPLVPELRHPIDE